MRFSGPIGRLIAETQEQQIAAFLAPVEGRRILDVGTGTGRAAIALAKRGAIVTGVDASAEMLRGGRAPGRGGRRARVTFVRGDAHRLDFPDRSFDAVVCLRVLMHTPDWRASLRELCRVAVDRVVFDYPSLYSAAALQAVIRRVTHMVNPSVEAYRVFSPARGRARCSRDAGFRVAGEHRQFVLPIALHKRVNSEAWTRRRRRADGARRADAPARLARDGRGASGARPSHRRDRLHGRSPRARARWRAATTCPAMVRSPKRAASTLRRGRHSRSSTGDLADAGIASPRAVAGGSTSSTTSPRCIARPGCPTASTTRSTPSAVGQLIEAAADGRRAPRRALQHGRRARRHRAPAGERRRAAESGRRLPGVEGRGGAHRARGGGADRRRGRDRAAERHLRSRRSPPAEAVPRRRAAPLRHPRRRQDLLPPDLHRRSRRRLPAVRRSPAGRGPHLHPRRRGSADAERTDRADRAGSRTCRRRRCICRCGRSGSPAPRAKRSARRSASSRRSIAVASISSPRAAPSTSRARATELGYAPAVGLRDGIRRTLAWYREQAGLALAHGYG